MHWSDKAPSDLLRGQWVQPRQAGKSREPAICGAQSQPILHCERRQMGVRHQIAMHPRESEKFAKQFGMTFGRLRDPCGIAREPSQYLVPCVGYRFGALKYARICHDSQECQQARPGQANARNTVQLPIEPIPSELVLRERADTGINQEVGVDQNQSKLSPSAIASASATLSMLGMRTRPRSTDCVRKGLRGFGRAAISRSPRRNASLTRSLKLAARFRRVCSSIAATSSSIVSVVLIHQNIAYLMP